MRKPYVISDLSCSLELTSHRPVADIESAVEQIKQSAADVLVAVGGGSPIDAAKAVSYHIHKHTETWIPIIALPTTLSVAENTMAAGYTNAEGHKVAILDPEMAPKGITPMQNTD